MMLSSFVCFENLKGTLVFPALWPVSVKWKEVVLLHLFWSRKIETNMDPAFRRIEVLLQIFLFSALSVLLLLRIRSLTSEDSSTEHYLALFILR